MKKFLFLVLLISTNALASGFPTFDGANLIQMLKEAETQASQFKTTIDQARNDAERLKSNVEGHWGIESLLDNSSMFNDLPSDWQSAYESVDISSLRDKYDMKSDNPDTQALFDKKLQDIAFSEKLYENSHKIQSQLMRLQDEFEHADRPTTKADLSNAIAMQKTQLESQQMLITRMNKMHEQEIRLIESQNSKKFINHFIKN